MPCGMFDSAAKLTIFFFLPFPLVNRQFIGCRWKGFIDPDSGIASYQWGLGTSPGKGDIIAFSNKFLQQHWLQSVPALLPVGVRLYQTVITTNGAGMSVSASSNGFIIDENAPQLVTNPFIVPLASLLPSTQLVNNRIQSRWDFSDSMSGVNRHTVVLKCHRGGSAPVVQRLPSAKSSTIWAPLSDGDSYTVTVVACNGAGLCQSADSSSVLVDSSPPRTGYFVASSSTVANLPSDRVTPLTFQTSNTSTSFILRFSPFFDLHSGVSTYWLDASSRYFNGFLLKNYTFTPQFLNSGIAQTSVTISRRLHNNERIYLTLWANNGLALRSPPLTRSFVAVTTGSNSGELRLDRSSTCLVDSCAGHCTCTAENAFCPSTSNCTDLGSLWPGQQVFVSAATSQPAARKNNVTAYTSVLHASWKAENTSLVLWYDWSVGRRGEAPGSGVYNLATEKHWFEVGKETSVVITLPRGKALVHGTAYVFYVRSWFSSDSYAIIPSEAFTVDAMPPSHNVGKNVREVRSVGDVMDADFTDSNSTVHIDWQGVFGASFIGGQTRYELAIGSQPGGKQSPSFGPLFLFLSWDCCKLIVRSYVCFW